MTQILSNEDFQSKSIYSDVCQNEAELEQIYKNSKILKNEQTNKHDISQYNKKLDNSHMKLYSKDSLNEKYELEVIDIKNEKCSLSEYKSCCEEKVKENDSINNNLNIDKEIKILDIENIKHFDLSTINSNSNSNNNFLEENTDFELNKIFEITFDVKSKKNEMSELIKFKKNDKNTNIKNFKNSFSLYEQYKFEDLNSNNSLNKKDKVDNPLSNRTYNSYYTNNKYLFESNKITNNNINNNIKSVEDFVINKINFKGISKDEIGKDYFNTKFKTITIKSKNINNPKNKNIQLLYELQDFIADDSSITVIKIDDEGKYLSMGFKSGLIKIYEIINYSYEKYKLFYDKNNLKEYLNFINETPFKKLTIHPNEIIDLFWLLSSNNFFLSSSLNLVVLWDFNSKNNNYIIKKFKHSETISCLSINPIIQNMFATGCTDKCIRLWSINKYLLKIDKSIKDYNTKDEVKELYVKDEIISINFLQEGDKIVIGTSKGKIMIYSIFPIFHYEYKFYCKDRFGKPITYINFFSNSSCIISSLDSRIRFMNIKDCKIIHKYKGHKNEKKNIKIGLDLCNDVIISGSENGYCYLWNVFNKENDNIKNYSYEYFRPFSSNDVINVAQIITEKCYVNYYQKILKITNKIMLDSIIISANDKGRIKIMLSINESF